ncbi:MAG: hypothetical protein R2849_04465 [Thermomicrobiales bacterium]
MTRFRSVLYLTAIACLLLALLGGSTFRSDGTALAQEGTAADTLPAVFTSDGNGVMEGYNIEGEFIDDETFENIFDVDPTDLEDLAVDYVTGVNIQSVFGASVLAADADTGAVFVSAGVVIDSSAIGFIMFDANFGEDDRLLTANLSRDNDDGPTQIVPDRAVDEILIVRGDTGLIDVYQYQPFISGFPIIHIDTLDLGIDDPEHVVAGDIGAVENDEAFGRFGEDGLAEIIVADPSTGEARFFDHTGEEIATLSGNLGFGPGDRLVMGNVNGVGGEDILVAHPDTGVVDMFDMTMNFSDKLLRRPLDSINVGFDADDQIDLVDVNGNGIQEILVAQADTSDADVFRYDLVEQTFFSEPSLPIGYSAGDLFTTLPIRYPDEDGDGLFDHWETDGVDVNGDGIIDIDLPSMGADFRHKDLFVEYDYASGEEPSRNAVQLVKDAFAASPVDAGGVLNPDREPGINIWIDTGGLTEGGQLVGDDLGGGEELPGSSVPANGICGTGSEFDDIKEEHFDPVRNHVFRYALSIDSPVDCDIGGQAEIGGNDFAEHINSDSSLTDSIDEAGMFMHELGHNLSLRHGGFENHNCKPNYISVMNYSYNFGIVRDGGVRTIDYAPAGVTGDQRGAAPLPPLVEEELDETSILDPTDDQNMLVFSDPDGNALRRLVNQAVNWNANTDADGNDIIDQDPVEANIDNVAIHDPCANSVIGDSTDQLVGHNDWQSIVMSVQNSDSSDAGVVEEPDFEEPTIDELLELEEQLHTSDLTLDLSAATDPAVAGTELDFTMTVENLGPNPADLPEVDLTLPDGLTFQDSDADCNDGSGEVICALDPIPVNDSTGFTVTVLVGADLVFDAGGTATVTTSATIEDTVEAAVDPDGGNNEASVETEVVAEADLEIVSFEATDAPLAILLDEATDVTLEKVVTNNGPSGPVDVDVTATAAPVGGGIEIEADPENPVTISGLDIEEDHSLTELFTLNCLKPGLYDVTFTNSVAARGAATTDPNADNNEAQLTVTVECIVPVAINIKPGDFPNVVDAENPRFPIPLAVLTTEAGEYRLPQGFDATTIDPQSVLLGTRDGIFDVASPTGSTERHNRGHIEDSFELDETTQDGDSDMVLHFLTRDSGLDGIRYRGVRARERSIIRNSENLNSSDVTRSCRRPMSVRIDSPVISHSLVGWRVGTASEASSSISKGRSLSARVRLPVRCWRREPRSVRPAISRS